MGSRHPARRRGYSERLVGVREPLERFLIVCEGEKTEPNYFRSFRVPREVVEVHGIGDNTLGVVQRAIELRAGSDFDQVWCVFDRDSFPAERFNAALELARTHGIEVAYSNEAFELWYLLHFHYYNTAIGRRDYVDRLSTLLGHRYEKGSTSIYGELLDRQSVAIKNAQHLLALYEPRRPAQDNPSTTVHLLVEQLNRFLR